MERWVKKTAVVTGASGGIGAAVTVALADAGLCVIGLARTPDKIDALQLKVSGKGSIRSRKCNVSSPDEVAAAFQWIDESVGGVHVLVNNAGVLYSGGFSDAGDDMISEKEMLETLDVNVKGVMLCARRAISSMNKHRVDGHIININSLAGHYVPLAPTFNMYPSTKYAITGFCGGLLNELAHYKSRIKVTSLSPGLVLTGLGGVAGHASRNVPALMPKDIADAVLYVLSTPPNVNINELTITSVTEMRL